MRCVKCIIAANVSIESARRRATQVRLSTSAMRPLRDHVPRLPSYDDYVASLRRSTCNNASISIVAVTVPEQHHDNTTRAFLDTYRRVALQNSWNYTTLRGVDGFNTTDVIESLLDTGIPFRNLSRGAKKWGKLAAFLTKIRALEHQVAHASPYQLTLEDDLHLRPRSFPSMVAEACARFNRAPVTLMQLSHFTEVLLTSLSGATLLLALLREKGLVRATDQQLLNPATMGNRHTVSKFLHHQKWPERPWILGRSPNSADGHIWRTRKITWAEMAMMRLLTLKGSRQLPLHGNPPLPARLKGTGVSGTWAT